MTAIGKRELPFMSSDNYAANVSSSYNNSEMANQDVPETLGGRIKLARRKAGLTQAELGRVFGITREAVSLWEADTNSPISDKIGRIAVETQVSADWLMTGRGDMAGVQPRMVSEPLDASGQARMTLGDIPIIGTVEGGPDGMFELNGEEIDHVARPAFLAGARGAYGLYVEGGSMSPRYEAGELVYVHPGRPIVASCYVVVQFFRKEGDSLPCAWIKQFVERGPKEVTLRQFNPKKLLKLPTKRIHAVHRVVGSGEL